MNVSQFLIFFLALIFQCQSMTIDQILTTTSLMPEDSLNTTTLIWPLPNKISINGSAVETVVDPCSINYSIQAVPSDYVKQMINQYLVNVFGCKNITNGTIQLSVVVKNATQMISEKKQDQLYSLTIRLTNKWELVANTHAGFLRGLQTFSQLFEQKNNNFVINGIPILIDDIPNFHWRGLMIDTSRHFLPITAIKHQIDALLYNKMSVLHWHIVDEDSFPLVIQSRPQLSNSGQIAGTYSKADILSIINYGKIRGVRIIPEIDTPAHTHSWGRSQKLKDIVVECNPQYQGQFDPTLDLTYNVINDVMKQINTIFQDNYVHFGGDEIVYNCYDAKPQIRQWMNQNNISTYKQLSIYYRQRQKSLWKNITNKKKAIYWTNTFLDLPVESDDVIHWWGEYKDVESLSGRGNQVILSYYDRAYLDTGFGGRRGEGYGDYISWREMYDFQPRVNNLNVIGGEACMWSQISDENVQDQKVWPRASIINQRLWNADINGQKDIQNIAARLIAQVTRMKQRGFKTSPVTVGLCELDPSICWNSEE